MMIKGKASWELYLRTIQTEENQMHILQKIVSLNDNERYGIRRVKSKKTYTDIL